MELKTLRLLLFIVVVVFSSVETLPKRVKRQDIGDRLNWGFLGDIKEGIKKTFNEVKSKFVPTETLSKEASPIPQQLVESTTPEYNPCGNPYVPENKTYIQPGRRISHSKCLQYLSKVKDRLEQFRQQVNCILYRNRHAGPNGPYYAIGGHSTGIGEYPHMVAIGWKALAGGWVFNCGGTLISERYVLTAAHCSRASERDTTLAEFDPKIVRLGDKNIIDTRYNRVDPYDVKIKRIIVHPQYNPVKAYNDIAIMELEEEVTFSHLVQPACLWLKPNMAAIKGKAVLTGWGRTSTKDLKTSPELQAAEVQIVDQQMCDSLLRPNCNRRWCGIEGSQICAGNLTGGVDACQGDSGGPLQVRIPLKDESEGAMHFVIGVTSFGFGCARANTPGVYTRVSSYVDWIESIVWP